MKINALDNVEVNLKNGHKYAVCDIKKGENVIKYGFPIGHAICDIKKGEHVHTHNLKTNLKGNLEYSYEPGFTPIKRVPADKTFMGYDRKDGGAGIRNYVAVISTVFCANGPLKDIVKAAEENYKENDHFRLQPENDTMKPIILDKVTILGKVVGLYRKFN